MLTNFFPVSKIPDAVTLRHIPYSEDALRDVKQKHNRTHSCFRFGEDILLAWMEGDDIDYGTPVEVRPDDSPEAVSSLTRHLLFRTFIREIKDVTPLSFSPLTFKSRQSGHDALWEHLPKELKGRISFTRQIAVHTRFNDLATDPIFGLLINIDRRWGNEVSIEEMISQGYSVSGCAVIVQEALPGLENILAPKENAIGIIQSVSGKRASIKTPYGIKEFDTNALFLRKRNDDLKEYLSYLLGHSKATELFNEFFRSHNIVDSPKHLNDELISISKIFSTFNFHAKCGFEFKVESKPLRPLAHIALENTIMRFDINDGISGDSPFSGILRHGPYDSSKFTPKSPRILVIYESSSRQAYSGLAGSLAKGVSDSKYFKGGLEGLYRLSNIEFVGLPVNGYTSETIKDALKAKLMQDSEFNLALVIAPRNFASASPRGNPYYTAKAILMSNGIPVQFVQEFRARLRGNNLGNILGPLALQVYAKLGGTPWTIQSPQDIDREVVVGIGHYIKRTSEFAGGEFRRVVSINTFFNGDGYFLMHNISNAVDYEEYLNELLANLESSIKELAGSNNWKQGERIRLIFHCFKPFNQIEIEAVDNLVSSIKGFQIDYAFVTVAKIHPYLLFDNSYIDEQYPWKNYMPQRMYGCVLDKGRSALVQLTGRDNVRNPKFGFPRPALIRLHEKSTFTDLHYITQQVADFSYLSWRSFSPTELPVTIQYANLIADLLHNLEELPDWNPIALNRDLRRKKWFL